MSVRSTYLWALAVLVLPSAVSTEGASIGRYGFRHDPMGFIDTSRSVQAVRARAFLWGRSLAGDREILEDQIARILSQQNTDGSIGKKPDEQTGGRLGDLASLGATRDRPEVERAVGWLLDREASADEFEFGSYALEGLCRLGVRNRQVENAARKQIENAERNTQYPGCPWSPAVQLRALSVALPMLEGADREAADRVTEKGLQWILEEMNSAGSVGHKDPFGFVDLVGVFDHPLAREVLLRELPLILRRQKADGSFGPSTFVVIRALKVHGLLDTLRQLPALPADWQIIRSIPAPSDSLRSLAWDGEKLWAGRPASGVAYAVSASDGSVLAGLKLPTEQVRGIGWCGDHLLVAHRKPKQLSFLDPKAGEIQRTISLEKVHWIGSPVRVNREIWVADTWMPCLWRFDERGKEEPRYFQPAGPLPLAVCFDGEAVWHVDGWSHAIIRTSLSGRLLDWGEIPFEDGCSGIAWDGENLWALDKNSTRISVIQRAGRQRPDPGL